MDWSAVVPPAIGAVLGGGLSLVGGAWQSRRAAASVRTAELRKRSEDAAREAADILIDIQRIASENLDRDESQRSRWLTSDGGGLIADRVLDLRRASRLVMEKELRSRMEEVADFLSAPSDFQELLFESPAVTARDLSMWIEDNVAAYLTGRGLPAVSRDIEACRATYVEALQQAEERWKDYEEWEKKERLRLSAERANADEA